MDNKLFKLLDSKTKNFFFLIVLTNLLSTILELAGVSSIYPLLILIFQGDKNEYLSAFLGSYNLNINNFSMLLIIIILSLFFLKNIFSIINNYLIQRFFLFLNYNFAASLSLKRMLEYEYLDILDIGSSGFIRNSKDLILSFRQYLLCKIFFYSEIIFILTLFSFLLFVDFKITLIISLMFFILLFIFFFYSKKKLVNLGEDRDRSNLEVIKIISAIYNSFRELKIYSFIDKYINIFDKKNSQYSLLLSNIEFFSSIIRYLFEIIIIIFLFTLTLFFWTKLDFVYIFPKIASFVIVFFRIYPSITKLSYLNTSLKVNANSVGALYELLKAKNNLLIKDNVNNEFNLIEKISIRSLGFKYLEKSNYLFDNINLDIERGDTIGITGQNGSGKTTLCNILLSLILPTKGKIIINDKFNVFENISNYRHMISFVPQHVFLFNDNIINNITFNQKLNEQNYNKIKIILAKINLNINYDTLVGENGSKLSGGQKQKIAIARCMYRESQIIIMDEHTSSLDINSEKEVMDDLVKLFDKKIMIIVSHKKEVLKFCNKIYNLKDGILSLSNNK
jgi:ABC-type bacteriocin/lantibiotic exporter with double-glycine peptidase domain